MLGDGLAPSDIVVFDTDPVVLETAGGQGLVTLQGSATKSDVLRLETVGGRCGTHRRSPVFGQKQSDGFWDTVTAGHGGSSTLRRTLAGLLLESEGYRTRRTDRVVLTDTDEIRLTSCMETHLRLSWCEHTTPREVELAIIEKLKPPLNVDHASGPLRDAVKAARDCYYASAPNH